MDANRQMQLSINSIISPPSVDTRGSNYNLIQSPPHGNGSVRRGRRALGLKVMVRKTISIVMTGIEIVSRSTVGMVGEEG